MMDSGVFNNSRSAALILAAAGKFPKAIQVENDALQIAQDEFGPTHPSLVPILDDLATIQRCVGQYKESEEGYKWGLALLEKNMGPDHPLVANSLDHLAALYNDLSRNNEAELLEKRALGIRENAAQPDPTSLAQTLGLMGQTELNLKNDGQAQALFLRALQTLDDKPDSHPGLSLVFLNALAQTYHLGQNFSEEQSTLEKALDTAQKNFRADGVEVADAMERLGDFFHSQNQDAKAQTLYESAFQIDQHYVGTVYSYPSLPYLKRLAKADGALGKIKESEDLWQKSIQTEKEVFGPRHPQIALDLIQLAQVETGLGKQSMAQADLKESLTILKIYFTDDNPWVLQAQKQLK